MKKFPVGFPALLLILAFVSCQPADSPLKNYRVLYLGNEATSGEAPKDIRGYIPGAAVTVLDQGTLVREGFSFSSWNTASKGTGKSYQPGDLLAMGSSDISLYAQWQEIPVVPSGTALWAKTSTEGLENNAFSKSATDSQGNIYVIGNQSAPISYGPGVATLQSGFVLVKYTSSGTPIWARTKTSTTGNYDFRGLALDALGNVYVVGQQYGTQEFSYGNLTLTGAHSAENGLILKYSPEGEVLWGRTASASETSAFSILWDVTVDSLGNIYTVGTQGQGVTTWGEGVSFNDSEITSKPIIVKWDSTGTPLWVSGAVSGNARGVMIGVRCTGTSDIIVTGQQGAAGKVLTWSGYEQISVSSDSTYESGFIGKLDSDGKVLWMKTVTGGDISYFRDLAVSSTGDIYVVGYQMGNSVYTYGPGVSASASGTVGEARFLLVKYNSSGAALWAQAVGAGTSGMAMGASVVLGSLGQIYTAGNQGGGTFTYGTGLTAAATSALPGLNSPVLIRWNQDGGTVWVKTMEKQPDYANYYGLCTDRQGSIVVSGAQRGNGTFGFGPGVETAGTASGSKPNSLLAKFKE